MVGLDRILVANKVLIGIAVGWLFTQSSTLLNGGTHEELDRADFDMAIVVDTVSCLGRLDDAVQHF